jgi:hypothetical protein
MVGKNWSAGGGGGEHGVRVPKMVWGKCALHEKRVRVKFFSGVVHWALRAWWRLVAGFLPASGACAGVMASLPTGWWRPLLA